MMPNPSMGGQSRNSGMLHAGIQSIKMKWNDYQKK